MSGYVLTADEGDAYTGARVVIKAASDDTSGQLGVMESTYPPGLSVPTHFHAGEDEMLYVLVGSCRLVADHRGVLNEYEAASLLEFQRCEPPFAEEQGHQRGSGPVTHMSCTRSAFTPVRPLRGTGRSETNRS